MEDLNNYLLADRLCPITGLCITIVVPDDDLFAVSYIIDELNPRCTSRILKEVFLREPIMDILRESQKQFRRNLAVNNATEIIITQFNYWVYVA